MLVLVPFVKYLLPLKISIGDRGRQMFPGFPPIQYRVVEQTSISFNSSARISSRLIRFTNTKFYKKYKVRQQRKHSFSTYTCQYLHFFPLRFDRKKLKESKKTIGKRKKAIDQSQSKKASSHFQNGSYRVAWHSSTIISRLVDDPGVHVIKKCLPTCISSLSFFLQGTAHHPSIFRRCHGM
jgi:hypothetical protein